MFLASAQDLTESPQNNTFYKYKIVDFELSLES